MRSSPGDQHWLKKLHAKAAVSGIVSLTLEGPAEDGAPQWVG
jgi:hypothetical protein